MHSDCNTDIISRKERPYLAMPRIVAANTTTRMIHVLIFDGDAGRFSAIFHVVLGASLHVL